VPCASAGRGASTGRLAAASSIDEKNNFRQRFMVFIQRLRGKHGTGEGADGWEKV
jgi:hypothetical protein